MADMEDESGAGEVADMASPRIAARERILRTGYDLFTRRGIRDVGVDEIIARAKTAKSTFYKYFPSKTSLILAVLELRQQIWTLDLVELQSRRLGGDDPGAQLLAIFDVFGAWFARADFDGCFFIKVLLEMGADHPAGAASIKHLANVREILRTRAERAHLVAPEVFASSLHQLMKGSILAAQEGEIGAAQNARRMALLLIKSHQSV